MIIGQDWGVERIFVETGGLEPYHKMMGYRLMTVGDISRCIIQVPES
jgi:hypothetical protein